MTEFSKGIVKALENIAGTSLGRATIYTMVHLHHGAHSDCHGVQ